MGTLKIKFNKFLFFIKFRIHLIVFLISVVSIFFVFLKVINLFTVMGVPTESVAYFLIFFVFLFSTIFIVLFLPSYPLFFVVLKDKEFNFLEKLSLTIVCNLSFYILIGYAGFVVGFPLTASFFFFSLVLFYFLIVFYIIFTEKRRNLDSFLKYKALNYLERIDYNDFSFKNYIKNKIPSNGLLLVIFVILICVFNVVRYEYFFGTDPWLHIFIMKSIVKMHYLPLEEYYGSVGLPLFGAVIHFFCGIDFVLIPKWFVFYTIPLSSLVFYNLLIRIFRNKNIACFGVFILESACLGFPYMMYQFWPTSLAVIINLTIFFLLYKRLEKSFGKERPTKKVIFSNIFVYYFLILTFFICSILCHVLTSIIFLLGYIWIFLIYFIRDYRRGFDFIFLCGLLGIYMIFINFGFSAEHFYFLERTEMPTFSYILILSMIGIIFMGAILVWRLQNSIIFTTGRFTKTVRGEVNKYYKTIEDKIIMPVVFGIIAVISFFYLIGNLLIFKLPITSILNGIQIMVFVAFAIWGIILFQKKPRGKLFLIWGLFFVFFFLIVFVFDILTFNKKYYARVFFLTPPLMVIGFISYIYKFIKSGSMNTKRVKLFLIFTIFFSLFTSYTHEYMTVQWVSLTRRQVAGAEWYSEHTEDKNVIITEFGLNYMFYYYDYPYNEKDEDLRGRHIHYFLDTQDNELFEPDEHTDNGTNHLEELKEEYETDVVITLDDQYYLNKGWETYGYVSEKEKEEYYEMEYLDRIYSAKSENGNDNAYYWVI